MKIKYNLVHYDLILFCMVFSSNVVLIYVLKYCFHKSNIMLITLASFFLQIQSYCSNILIVYFHAHFRADKENSRKQIYYN